MTNQHRATPEQWAECERNAELWSGAFNCILELRARVEALEAAAISAPENPDTSSDRPSPTDSLVERVKQRLIQGVGGTWEETSRAAIREVAAWLREGPDRNEFVASALEQEANR